MTESAGVLEIIIIVVRKRRNKMSTFNKYATFIILTLARSSCRSKDASTYTAFKKNKIEKWLPLLNEEVTIAGNAVNLKLGACLQSKEDSIIFWINGLKYWPEEYYDKEVSKTVKVKGVLIEKYDLPVFRNKKLKKDEVVQSGIPIPDGINLKLASHRFLLKDATWTIIDE